MFPTTAVNLGQPTGMVVYTYIDELLGVYVQSKEKLLFEQLCEHPSSTNPLAAGTTKKCQEQLGQSYIIVQRNQNKNAKYTVSVNSERKLR
eukprot:m.106610 g.106610  ORF g.106610 m.106610 type:complete len:91 (-) comp15157_c1_seq3:491-763(-)